MCVNPLLPESNGFILHTKEPQILAEIFSFDKMDIKGMNDLKMQGYQLGTETTHKDITYVLVSDYKIDPTSLTREQAQAKANRLAGLMRRMADWWLSVLIQLEKNNAKN